MPSDDDAELSTSSREFLESPAKAKREALKAKLKKEGLQHSSGKPTTDLKKLKLWMQVQRQKDQVPKKEDAAKTFGTKTREQEFKDAKLTAETKTSPDQLVTLAKKDEQAKDALQKEQEVQGEQA